MGGFEPIATLSGASATLTIPAATMLGLVYGIGACALACLPFLAPVLVATGDDARSAWRRLLPFSLGRITGYALLGGLSAALGGLLTSQLGSWPAWMLGSAALLLGIYLFTNSGKGPRHGCSGKSPIMDRPPMAGGLFMLGSGMALNPACPSLGLILLSAAALGSVPLGLMLGIAFGVGASLGPLLLYGVVFAQLSAALHQWALAHQHLLQRTAALLLGLFGLVTVLQ